VVVPENSFLQTSLVSQLKLSTRYNLILLGIVDQKTNEQMHFIAEESDRKLNPGDTLVILGPSREIRAFKKDVKNE
jgi:voltage-gated potassium channel